MVSVYVLTPPKIPPSPRSVKPEPVLTCHRTAVGVGKPSPAEAVKVAVPPASTVWPLGLPVTLGGVGVGVGGTLSNTPTVPPLLATTRSGLRSPLTSATATETGV